MKDLSGLYFYEGVKKSSFNPSQHYNLNSHCCEPTTINKYHQQGKILLSSIDKWEFQDFNQFKDLISVLYLHKETYTYAPESLTTII